MMEKQFFVRDTIQYWISNEMISPRELFSAIQEAFKHGECLTNANISFTESQLATIWDGLGLVIRTCKELE